MVDFYAFHVRKYTVRPMDPIGLAPINGVIGPYDLITDESRPTLYHILGEYPMIIGGIFLLK